MSFREFPSKDPQTRGWVAPDGTRFVGRRVRGARDFMIAARIEAGTRDERPIGFGGTDPMGVAHTGEHKPFIGTMSYPGAWEIPRLVESLNGSFSAYTEQDSTSCGIRLPLPEARLAIKIVSEMIKPVVCGDEILFRELRVIENERATANSLRRDSWDIFTKLYGHNPFAYPVIGTKESIASTTFKSISDFRARTYRSGALVIACEGDMPPDQMRDIALEKISLPPGARQKTPGPSAQNGRLIFDERRETETTSQTFAFPMPEPGAGGRTDVKYQVFWDLFHDGSAAFSLDTLRVNNGLLYKHEAYSWLNQDTGAFFVNYDSAPGDANRVRALFAEEFSGFMNKTDFYRERFEANRGRKIYEIESRLMYNPFYGTDGLAERALFDGHVPHREYVIADLRSLTFDDMVDAYQKMSAHSPMLKMRGIQPPDGLPDDARLREEFAPVSPLRGAQTNIRPTLGLPAPSPGEKA